MLTQTSRQEILRKVGLKIGYPIWEEQLTPTTRQAITNLATVERHLAVITEVLRGEQSRIDRSRVIRAASKLGKDKDRKERAALSEEVGKLQAEVDAKISELTSQIIAEEVARKAGQPPPGYSGNLKLKELKCPSCGAALPMPMGRFVTCNYCGNSSSVQEISSQLRDMIQGI